ncbi:MAG: VOC family protein [Melioribacteraceae bacterium]|nr:VOC family protein [Melioribacteraceae bacterium]MCF8262985.1 VOC family protein [Melioribacteraceae bacterium]MCF8430582.1 VOC family protein [Melioribacteraceae bacterium]
MKIKLTSVYVDDQTKALEFYTEKLGFKKKNDFPAGEYRWLTVISPTGHDDVELLLEPNANPTAVTYQEELFEQGIPAASFEVDDINSEFERLKSSDVKFTMEPTDVDSAILAIFEDTVGNLIQIHQVK